MNRTIYNTQTRQLEQVKATPKQLAALLIDEAIEAWCECGPQWFNDDMEAATASEREAVYAQIEKYRARIAKILAAGLPE